MSSVLSGSSMILNNVYIKSIGTTCGIDEFNGPLGNYFDRHYPDLILSFFTFLIFPFLVECVIIGLIMDALKPQSTR